MKKFFKSILYLLLSLIIAFGLFLLYSTLTDYKPESEILLSESNTPDMIADSAELSLLIWNIGYCGLSQEMDFFYDGGKNVRPDKEISRNNLNNILDFMDKKSSHDFILLQEVDKNSKRSYGMNQFEEISSTLSGFHNEFAENYKVKFVIVPPTEPMGRVHSGLASFSKYESAASKRYQFPGNYAWPKSLMMLDRCFLVERFPTENGNELLVINTHNSAYDDGSLKQGQMDYLENILVEEYKKGNYVIVGGDWNQCPPNFKPNFHNNIFDSVSVDYVEENYPAKGWQFAYADNYPTNRRLPTAYSAETSLTTVIDYFLISPNVELIEVQNINLDFRNADHQPVRMKVRLN